MGLAWALGTHMTDVQLGLRVGLLSAGAGAVSVACLGDSFPLLGLLGQPQKHKMQLDMPRLIDISGRPPLF